MNKNISIMFFLLFYGGTLLAQQEAQYTQFMFSKLALNPAYAGTSETACISILHRSQWLGLDGAPTSQMINFQMPFMRNRVGFGMSLSHDKIGPTDAWTYRMMYSYRIKVGNGNLALGLQGGLRRYGVKLTDAVQTHEGDFAINEGTNAKILPNVGMGIYYQSEKYFLGASIPNVVKSDLTFYDETLANNSDFSREEQHFYFMGGMVLDLAYRVKFKPAVLVKYNANSPIATDINASFIFFNKIWIGGTYRLGGNKKNSMGESIDAMVQYQLTENIKAGVAYDFTLSKLRSVESGTYEIMLDYCFPKENGTMTNPRFF